MAEKPDWKKDLAKQNILDKLNLSVQELSELGIGWLISASILIYLNGMLVDLIERQTLPEDFIIFLLVFGFSFFTHELMHKFTAQRFGARAYFRISREGLIITLLSVLVGFPMLAVGAVFWWGEAASSIGIRGRVSAAGPISNLILIGFSYILIGISYAILPVNFDFGLILLQVGISGVSLNIFIGLFNLLPIGVLDGAKVLAWDVRIWIALIGIFLFFGFIGGGFGLF
ncbi:MAG: M50 family metallopeptidase [Candidatus Hodarchaeales archaeon]|jgi:Zn-dependent protease